MSGKKLFFPVIHCAALAKRGIAHAMENTCTAEDNGADGVFLIGHEVHYGDLRQIYDSIRKQFPKMWIGINFLDIAASRNRIDLFAAVKACIGLDGLWIDWMPDSRLELPRTIQVFGGVAFKYMAPHLGGEALVVACEKAVSTVNVATTSGDKTGSPPSVEKLEKISRLLGGRIPLAVASGVNADNVTAMLPHVDIFLVASSLIEKDADRGGQEYFVPERVRECADKIHAYKA